MLKSILLALVISLSSGYFGQVVPSSCTAAIGIVNQYKKDADLLALRKTYDIGSTYKDSVTVNPVLSRKCLDALLAVYNATTIPERDSVINIFKIHAFPDKGLNYVMFEHNNSLQWMVNLGSGITPTGYNPLDSMMSRYFMKLYSFSPSFVQGYSYVVLKSDSCWNTYVLASRFHFPGGGPTGFNPIWGDGNDIWADFQTNFINLSYSIGWEDCPSGCIYRRIWKFRIYNNCSVEFIGAEGTGFPGWVGLKEVKNAVSPIIDFYPNPVKDRLKIEANVLEYNSLKYSLCDNLGQPVLNGRITEHHTELNLSSLTPGVYFLKINTVQKVTVYKVLKE